MLKVTVVVIETCLVAVLGGEGEGLAHLGGGGGGVFPEAGGDRTSPREDSEPSFASSTKKTVSIPVSSINTSLVGESDSR